MKFPKILRHFYYKYFDRLSVKTVQLRGRLSDADEKFWNENKNIWKSKNVQKEIEKNNFKSPILEIGFGNGSHLIHLGEFYKNDENKIIFGVDLYRAGIIVVLKKLNILNLQNIKVFHEDARYTLSNFADESIEKIFVLFPDPWRKTRHQKRRIIQTEFILKCLEKIKTDGEIFIASDWENYTEYIVKILENLEREKRLKFERCIGNENTKYKEIFETTFAKRAIKENRIINIFKINK
jgi:tRNA (guanine-N7-)-methyltransferase